MASMASRRFDNTSLPSQRQLRVGELIRRTLSEVLMQGHVHDPELNRLSITVGEVRTSPDLRIATAYVLPLGGRHRKEAIAALKRNKHELRRAIGRAVKLKYTPDLRFQIDETFDQMDESRRLFQQENVQRDLRKDRDQGEGGDGGQA